MLTNGIPCPNCHFTGPNRTDYGCHICAPESFQAPEGDPMWEELMRARVALAEIEYRSRLTPWLAAAPKEVFSDMGEINQIAGAALAANEGVHHDR